MRVTLMLLACASPAPAAEQVRDGAPISAEFAASLYARVAKLQEPDGCRITRFDTARYRIAIGIAAPAGGEHFFELATTSGLLPRGETAGDWSIAVAAPLARDCPTTVATIRRILGDTLGPTRSWSAGDLSLSSSSHYALLAATFLLVLVGTLAVLHRESAGAPARAVAALVLVWAVGLGLRLWLSPWTFLHEYYHIAETVPAYLSGETFPGYGKTGPALFRLVGLALGRGDDVQTIFLTNAVISSLAIPAAGLLVLAVTGSWGQALCAAVLLAVLPQHLRFSAAEDLFVQAITFGMWSLALFASYLRTGRRVDVLLGALVAALATQTRPDMIFFPVVLVAFILCVRPGGWRALFAWPTVLAGVLLAALLVPHVLDVLRSAQERGSGVPNLPILRRYLETLILLDRQVTPILYPLLIVVGAGWASMRRRGWLLWIVAVYVGFTLFSISMFDNPPWRLRSQNLPMSYLVLLAAGVVPVWRAAWRRHARIGDVTGVALLALSALAVVAGWRGFVAELKDQQLEWAFLERRVPELPADATLLTAVDTGGSNLDAFPEFLLARSGRRYPLVDVRRAAAGTVAWPPPTDELLFYQGMFCYFAFDREPSPDPMTPVCRAVHERYVAEPLLIEDLRTEGYSALRYAQGGRGTYRIGFYRLKPRP